MVTVGGGHSDWSTVVPVAGKRRKRYQCAVVSTIASWILTRGSAITSQESKFCCLFSFYCGINIKEKLDLGHRTRDRAWEEPLKLEQPEIQSQQQSRYCDEPVHSELHSSLLLFVRFFRVREAEWRNVQKLSSNFPLSPNSP